MVSYAPSRSSQQPSDLYVRVADHNRLKSLGIMRLDYSPVEPVTRPGARRSFLIAALVLVSVGAVMSRQGDADPADHDSSPSIAAQAVEATIAEASAASLVAAPVRPATAVAESPWTDVTVKAGDTLSQIFDRQGLPALDWVQILQLDGDVRRLKSLRAGDTLRIQQGAAGLEALDYGFDESHTLQIRRAPAGFASTTVEADIERRANFASGSIRTSPWEAGIEAGLPESLIIEMADIFGYDIDFGQDLRIGDRFTVIYDELYKDGARLRAGTILAAEFVNQGKALRAVRYTDPQGQTGYFAPEGQSLRKAFIRTPLDVFRISSNFSYGRRHPVLNKIRAHLGTDYAAGTGTPVKATGDGRISYMGWKGGYGKLITIRHGSSIETAYGHLSRFKPGLGQGSRVQQGQIIGYVGKTGLATGPHLHYEFRVNGAHRNPRTVALPRSNALPRQHLEHFRASSNPLLAQLDALDRSRLAQAN